MNTRGLKKRFEGTVVSDKMDKTVIVTVERLVRHEEYKKYVRRTSRFAAHDEENRCAVGDKVVIMESRPISRMKRWRVVDIVSKAV